MAKEESNVEDKSKKKKGPIEITFKCQSCGKSRHLEDMRVISRFYPMLVTCRDCEKEMR